MIWQLGHNSFTRAVKNGLSLGSSGGVLFSGSRRAILAPVPPLDAAFVLDVPDELSSEPQPAAASASDAVSSAPTVARRVNLGNISPPRAMVAVTAPKWVPP